jgi:hypothetical protein
VISTFLSGHGGEKVTLIIFEKKFHLLCGYFWKDILYGMAQKKSK